MKNTVSKAPVRIERAEAILVDLPTTRPHILAMTTLQQQSLVIVRLLCSDGIEGIGEATTIGGLAYGEESPEGIKLTLDKYLSPLLLERDATNIRSTMALMDQLVRGNHFAKSAIETALLDAQAKRLDISVATLLGGSVIAPLPVLWTLASGETARDIEEAETLIATNGYKRFKIKVGRRDPMTDVEHVRAISKAVGDHASITVDVNQAWSESQAKRAIAALEDMGVALIEQPLARHNLAGMARLSARFLVPIMADESLSSPESAFEIVQRPAADVFALKIGKFGGLLNTLKIAAVAETAGIELYGGTMLEGTIGTLASAHVFSVLRSLSWGTELFGPLLLEDDIVIEPIEYRDGFLHVPSESGLGANLDEDKLAFYRRDRSARRTISVGTEN